MSFALLKKWSQLTHHYPQFPEGMELIGVYGDDGGYPNEDGVAKAKEILNKLDYVGYDEGVKVFYKIGNPDDTFDLMKVELEWDLGDFVLAFEDLLEEFEGYPEQLQLEILQTKFGMYPDDEDAERILALLREEGCGCLEDIGDKDNHLFAVGEDKEFLVLTDSEADDRWDEELDRYIEDCLEIPEAIRPYFDDEHWKRDARMDGRGHSIATYDGAEDSQVINGTTYYIYRMN
jgi:hypothetical protein